MSGSENQEAPVLQTGEEVTIITRQAALELAKQIMTKQKGDKQQALFRIVEDYKTMLGMDKEPLYRIVPGAKCGKCGGIILEMIHIFSRVTCGGNPVIGCPVCGTFSSEKMLHCRDDIKPTHEDEKTKPNDETCPTLDDDLTGVSFSAGGE